MSRTSRDQSDPGPADQGLSGEPADRPDPADRHDRHDRRTAWLAVGGVVVLLIALYGAAVAFAGDQIAAGTRVADVGIGGLAPAEAAERLRRQLRPRADDPIPVSIGDREAEVDPAAAGLSIDVAATVDRAGGGAALDPRALWDSFFGGDDVAPVTRVDQGRLVGVLEQLSTRTDRTPVEPTIGFDETAEPVVRQPSAGRRLEIGRSAVALLDAWLVEDGTVDLPVAPDPPEAGRTDLRRALQGVARTLVSAPVELRVPGRTLRLQPQRYAPALAVEVVDGRLAPTVDAEALAARLRGPIRSLQQPARDAAVELVGARPRVVPARAGVEVNQERLASALLRAATDDRSRQVRVGRVQDRPGFTTAEARGLRIRRPVSSFTTYYPHEDYRNTNIGRAANLINGTVLRPGETFSLNGTVGERTPANGFVEGFIISNGVFAEDYGGGVSQVATTVFNAAFFAGLEDVEHKPHSFYIDRYPAGREATVAWGLVDLRFRNDTPYGLLLETWIEPSAPGGTGSMNARIWSTKRWDIQARASQRYGLTSPGTRVIDGDECVPTSGYGGFDIDVYRDFYRPGSDNRVRTERFHTTYLPADTVICR